ncbi:MAG: LysE family translocator [Sulfurovum sp.]|nr:LysE family translocator [Sulfurovum sp.]
MQDIYTLTMLLSIISFAVATAFSPGPNNLMLLSSGLTFGYRKTLPHIIGVMIGFPLMLVAVGLGVGTVFEIFPTLYDILKVLGMVYLLWMAWQIANSNGSITQDKGKKKIPFTCTQAILFQWLNPKAWIMAITATTSFTHSEGHLFVQILMIAFVYVIVGLGSTNSWALGGLFLQKVISNTRGVRVFNVTMAVLIVLSVLPFVFY